MPRKARAPRTVEDNISFQAHKIVTTLQSVPKLKLPTPEEAAQQLLMQAIRNVQAKQQKKSFWTEGEGIYFNRETGRPYKPHSKDEEKFVYSDTPTNCAVFGSEGCVAAETLIDAVPIAERKAVSPVWTLGGFAFGTGGYLKGQADLYRVRIESGREVVVTKDHRFLAPDGWRRLSDLRVGDLIACGDEDYVRGLSERLPDFQDGYLSSSRLCDESPNLAESALLSNMLQHSAARADRQVDEALRRDRACRNDSSFLRWADNQPCESSRPSFSNYDRLCLDQLHIASTELQENPLQDILSLPFAYPMLKHWNTFASMKTALPDVGYASWSPDSCSSELQFLWLASLCGISVQLLHSLSPAYVPVYLSSYSDYILKWDKIANITFQKYGDYYDLSVPYNEHYFAQGIYHHNSGKSVAGIIKTLEKIRRKMSGAISSPDLPHLKKSLWPEFQRWNVWQEVIDEHQYMQQFGWSMREPTLIAYKNGATLLCGGMDNPMAWEGPNLNFAYIDEARRLKDATALKTLKGRIRIAGPEGQQPQFFVTTTKPRNTDHWLYEYFGDVVKDEEGNIDDPQLSFKQNMMVVNLLLTQNLENLSDGFLEQRKQGLSPEEIRLLVDNEWVELDEQESFLPSIALWDSCKEELPALDTRTPLVLSLDAAEVNDTFFATACSWHPTRGRDVVALRYSRCWEPKGHLLDFDEIEKEIGTFIDTHRVVLLTFDAALIRQMCARLSQKVWAREFSQQRDRLIADKGLLDSIMQRTIVHDGSHLILRKHLMNADKKTDTDGRKCRIVKRSANLKIDGAVSLSMAREWASSTKLNLGLP